MLRTKPFFWSNEQIAEATDAQILSTMLAVKRQVDAQRKAMEEASGQGKSAGSSKLTPEQDAALTDEQLWMACKNTARSMFGPKSLENPEFMQNLRLKFEGDLARRKAWLRAQQEQSQDAGKG